MRLLAMLVAAQAAADAAVEAAAAAAEMAAAVAEVEEGAAVDAGAVKGMAISTNTARVLREAEAAAATSSSMARIPRSRCTIQGCHRSRGTYRMRKHQTSSPH